MIKLIADELEAVMAFLVVPPKAPIKSVRTVVIAGVEGALLTFVAALVTFGFGFIMELGGIDFINIFSGVLA